MVQALRFQEEHANLLFLDALELWPSACKIIGLVHQLQKKGDEKGMIVTSRMECGANTFKVIMSIP